MSKKLKQINLKYRIKRLFRLDSNRVFSILLFVFGVALLPVIFVNSLVRFEYGKTIFNYEQFEELEDHRVAIVFGAAVDQSGEHPDTILKDRLDSAVVLYSKGKVQKIIVSGDDRYNEPLTMYKYLISQEVADFDIVVDLDGRSTYETCYRAKEIFGVTEAILVTQRFHLPRALYSCETLGIEVVGAAADLQPYEGKLYNQVRETLALLKAFYNLHVSPPEVISGEKVVI